MACGTLWVHEDLVWYVVCMVCQELCTVCPMVCMAYMLVHGVSAVSFGVRSFVDLVWYVLVHMVSGVFVCPGHNGPVARGRAGSPARAKRARCGHRPRRLGPCVDLVGDRAEIGVCLLCMLGGLRPTGPGCKWIM